MGTRSIINFIGPDGHSDYPKGFSLYQHWDGYPTNILPILRDVLREARKRATADHERYMLGDGRPFVWEKAKIPAEMLAGLYIGKETDIHGMGARLERTVGFDAGNDWLALANRDALEELLGGQCDLEWVYVVDSFRKTVNVYSTSYNDGMEAVLAGRVNPLEYAEHLIESYQPQERKRIKAAVASLKRLGWPVGAMTDDVLKYLEPVEER